MENMRCHKTPSESTPRGPRATPIHRPWRFCHSEQLRAWPHRRPPPGSASSGRPQPNFNSQNTRSLPCPRSWSPVSGSGKTTCHVPCKNEAAGFYVGQAISLDPSHVLNHTSRLNANGHSISTPRPGRVASPLALVSLRKPDGKIICISPALAFPARIMRSWQITPRTTGKTSSFCYTTGNGA